MCTLFAFVENLFESDGLSRRRFLVTAGGGALGLAALGANPINVFGQLRRTPPKRVVVIGGGIAGVSLAWLLDGVHNVVLLEADEELGGHARTIDVSQPNGPVVPVDIGAQYFSKQTYPTYWRLVKSILNVPTIPTPLDTTFMRYGQSTPIMVSPTIPARPDPLFDPAYAEAFMAMGLFVRQTEFLEQWGSWDTTVEQFVESMVILPHMKQGLIYPFFAAITGCSIPTVKKFSARALTPFIARPLTEDLKPFDYHNAAGGLRAIIRALTSNLETVRSYVNAPATSVAGAGAQYNVVDAEGRVYPADHIVFALPPHAVGPLIKTVPYGAALKAVFDRFTYFPATILIHRDPTYMPAERKHWSAYNATVDGDWCEASMWYGSFRKGANLFKSWGNRRREQPRELVERVHFRHALITPEFIAAQRMLDGYQGKSGLWFAGTHTDGIDSQESALLSAVRVARRLAPSSTNLRRLLTSTADEKRPKTTLQALESAGSEFGGN